MIAGRVKRLLFPVLFLASLFFGSHSSATQATARDIPSFRSTARVVLIDVLVTDAEGNPVFGLKPEDFSLSDNGTPQTLSAVEEHQLETLNAQQPPLALGPASTSNWLSSPAKGTATVLVFDILNTTARDKVHARIQMLKCLRSLPPGQQVALFVLGTRLRMIHDFTTDSEKLSAAASTISTGPSPLSPLLDDPGLSNRTERMDLRVKYTLDAFRDLARVTASLPGRKNVIWLTTGFPVRLDLSNERLSPPGLSREREYTDAIRQLAATLASTQVAIYPMDVIGLLPAFDDQDSPEYRETLVALAHETGGRAYYNKNDVDARIAQVIANDSNYYTLAYNPGNIKWDGSYHHVSVRVARKQVQLTYRRGYHAVGDSPLTEKEAARSMGEVLNIDALDSRMIVFSAKVSPPAAPRQSIEITCNIAPNTLFLDETADGSKTAALAIGASVWNAKNKKVADVARKVEATLKPDELALATTTGIPWKLNVVVRPGAYTLKLAIVDLKSGKTGSLSLPLQVDTATNR